MFRNATAFNGDISSWNVSSVINMDLLFFYTSAFTNHDLSGWGVDYTDDTRTTSILHSNFSTSWGSENTEPI